MNFNSKYSFVHFVLFDTKLVKCFLPPSNQSVYINRTDMGVFLTITSAFYSCMKCNVPEDVNTEVIAIANS